MPRFAANLSMMFHEVPFLERFERARAAGFQAVEFMFPYAFDVAAVRHMRDEAALQVVLFNTPPGDWDRGERGLAAVPGREADFRQSFERALDYAGELDCPRLHVMAGVVPEGVAVDECERVFIDNLRWAAERARPLGIRLCLEPINSYDMPGYVLTTHEQARRILTAVAQENVRFQFDFYHTQRMQGDLTRRFEEMRPLVEHVQIAGVPGRHEPDVGEIHYEWIFRRLDELGYAGWVGLEYRPRHGTEEGLGWLRRWQQQSTDT